MKKEKKNKKKRKKRKEKKMKKKQKKKTRKRKIAPSHETSQQNRQSQTFNGNGWQKHTSILDYRPKREIGFQRQHPSEE